jgi:hypothetical protein
MGRNDVTHVTMSPRPMLSSAYGGDVVVMLPVMSPAHVPSPDREPTIHRCCCDLTGETQETLKGRERVAKRHDGLGNTFRQAWRLPRNEHWTLIHPDDRRVVIMASTVHHGMYGYSR